MKVRSLLARYVLLCGFPYLFCRPFGTSRFLGGNPSAKSLGYFREVPAGLDGTAGFRVI
jgi:hypothetical protein